jgi:hypothetical protein
VIARTGIQTAGSDPIEVGYRMVYRHRAYGEQIIVTAVEGGTRKICGDSTPRAEALFDHGDLDNLTTGPATRLSPRDLMAIPAPSSYHQASSRPYTPSDLQPGQTDGWITRWRPKGYGGITASVVRYTSPTEATRSMHVRLTNLSGDAVEAIRITGLHQARGLRVTSYAWLLIQPPDRGPYNDFVYSRYGDTLVGIAVGNASGTSSHSIAASLAHQIDEVARGQST